MNGWETYTIRDVSVAAWTANRKDGMTWEWRLNRFAEQLENKMTRCEEPEVEPPPGPMM